MEDDEEDDEEESIPGSTLFIKNLSFSTTAETLKEVGDTFPGLAGLFSGWMALPYMHGVDKGGNCSSKVSPNNSTRNSVKDLLSHSWVTPNKLPIWSLPL